MYQNIFDMKSGDGSTATATFHMCLSLYLDTYVLSRVLKGKRVIKFLNEIISRGFHKSNKNCDTPKTFLKTRWLFSPAFSDTLEKARDRNPFFSLDDNAFETKIKLLPKFAQLLILSLVNNFQTPLNKLLTYPETKYEHKHSFNMKVMSKMKISRHMGILEGSVSFNSVKKTLLFQLLYQRREIRKINCVTGEIKERNS